MIEKLSETFFISLLSFGIFIGLILLLIIVFVIRYRKRKRDLDLKEMAFKEILLRSQLEIQEQTLKSISQEIHDNLGTTASVIKNYLLTLPIDDKSALTQMLGETQNQVRELIADIKSISVRLSGDHINYNGIIKSLNNEVARLSRLRGLQIGLVISQPFHEPEPDRSIILFRMTQEILNNAVKHSEAKKIEITVTTSEKSLILEISDDGIGFDVAEKKKSGGSGLLNLYSRANLIQASLNIQSTPGSGTIISIALPLS